MERHHHDHHHDHHHHHALAAEAVGRTLVICIVINLLYVIAEAAVGIWQDSMGLLADAGHNLGDTASLLLSYIAVRLSQKAANHHYTYGYKKSTILASLTNAVILLIAVGVIFAECVGKFIHPNNIEGLTIAWVAGIGVVINAATAYLLMRKQGGDLNIRGAYLHMAMDTLVSVGVVVSGIVIHYTGWDLIDPIIGIVIGIVIVVSTWSLLHDSLRLSLDGVPSDIDVEAIEAWLCEDPGVKGCHHLHVWGISTSENALTVHIEPHDMAEMETIKQRLKAGLRERGIHHATLEFEERPCEHPHCGE